MGDIHYTKELKRDITLALCVKGVLIALLILGCKYLKQETKEEDVSPISLKDNLKETHRYPLFKEHH